MKYRLINGKWLDENGQEMPAAKQAEDAARLRDMLESRRAPGVATDSTFFAGVGTLDKQFNGDKRALRLLRRNAKRMGVSLTGNEFYQPGLAQMPCDPRACISQGDGKHRIKQIAERTGSGCSGAVNVKPREPESAPKPKYKLHPKIVRRMLKQELANPANATVDRRELVEKIVDKHGSKTS